MAYGNIYTKTFVNMYETETAIAIQKKDYAGESYDIILNVGHSITIQYNLKDRIYSTGAIINILNDFADKFLFAKMTSEPYETYKLTVKQDGDIYFEGFLLPQTFTQDIKFKSFVGLTFSNGLTMLENITPSFLTEGIDDYITEMDILINIFSYLNLNYTIYINTTLYEDSMSEAEKADNPLRFTYINRLGFQKNDLDWDDALTILNKILKSINADCYIRGERIMIERFIDRNNNPKTFWTYNPVTEVYSSTEEAFSETNLDNLKSEAGSVRYQIDPPIKKLNVKLNLLQFNNIISNNFDKNICESPLTFFYWMYSHLLTILDTNFSNNFMTRGISFTKSGDTWTGFENAYLSYYSVFTNKNDDVILSLKYKCWKRVPVGYVLDFYYMIALRAPSGGAWKYINENDDIVADEVYLKTSIENDGGTSKFDFNINRTFDLVGKLDELGDMDVAIVVKAPQIGTIANPDVRNPRDGIYGDFSLNQDNMRINNLLEADLNNEAYKTIEEELDLYDAGYINYRTTKLLKTNDAYRCANSWTDGLYAGKPLQHHYILNRGNLYNSSCPVLTRVCIDPAADIRIDDIFYTALLKDDLNNNMKFYIDDFCYNMRQHTYALTLRQWIATVGKTIA